MRNGIPGAVTGRDIGYSYVVPYPPRTSHFTLVVVVITGRPSSNAKVERQSIKLEAPITKYGVLLWFGILEDDSRN